MNLSEISIKRPVFAVVCSIVIIIFGFIGYSFLGVREYPAIDPPVVNVRTSYEPMPKSSNSRSQNP
jgi:multidrug efflux pump